MRAQKTLDQIVGDFNALGSQHAQVERLDNDMLMIRLSPVVALRFMLDVGATAQQRQAIATPFGASFMARLRDKVFRELDVPTLFERAFTPQRPAKLLNAALGLYMYASDTGAPKEAAPSAAFALAKLNTTLDAQRPSRAYAFVAKNVGILMGVPELAALGERHVQRAFSGQKDEAKRAQMRRVLTDVRSLNPQIRGG